MVSIVIVSHSAQLAAGVRELAQQMVQEDVQIAVAGGIDDPDHPIGTDAIKVLEAIRSVALEDGVLVLMDLGSALLSAETALEFLEPAEREQVRLCPAPLIEGALAAAVQASVGASLDAVYAEAMQALGAKQAQMHGPLSMPEEQPEVTPIEGLDLHLVIPNRLGLHARPAARFVATASRFQAHLTVRKGQRQANAKSINQVATLGARQGDEIVVTASGPDAGQALEAIKDLAADNFGDVNGDAAPPAAASTAPTGQAETGNADELRGIAASPGIAMGPLVHYRPALPEVEITESDDPDYEWGRLQEAIAKSLEDISKLRRRMRQQGSQSEAEIFSAHELILRDPALLESVERRIVEEEINAAGAWKMEIDVLAGEYREIEDDYMRERAADVLDVGRRVLGYLLSLMPQTLELDSPAILAATDFTPSDTARFDPQQVLGICTELGGATSHSAILARALGIPAIVGIGPALQALPEGERVAMDGEAGVVWRQPNEARTEELLTRQRRFQERREEARRSAQQEASTIDRRRLEIAANIGGLQDVSLALASGAEGVGLFRTEFLFMDRSQAPSEDEQVAAYREVARAFEQRPVIIRTLDVGGDKPLPYLQSDAEDNPFLGWRGIRFCLDNSQIFLPQLKAILRAAHGHNIKLMFPMVSALSELNGARTVLGQARQALQEEGKPFAEKLDVGIMIEVPAAAAIADQLAQEVDFFSIGTNDLTQYVMAADRGNRRVANLADALQPAVLRLIAQTVEAGHRAGIWVGMCGELAGNALATPLLVGLGLDELSMSAPSIPQVKARVRQISYAEARKHSASILRLPDAAAVAQALPQMIPDAPD